MALGAAPGQDAMVSHSGAMSVVQPNLAAIDRRVTTGGRRWHRTASQGRTRSERRKLCVELRAVHASCLTVIRFKESRTTGCAFRIGQPVFEITSHGDPLRINLGKQMDRGGWTHQASRLNRFWSVHLPPIRRAADRLPYRYVDLLENLPELENLLSEFEMTGVFDVGPWEPSSQYERLRALGVESAQGLNNGEPSINVLPPGGGGGSGPGAVAGAVQVELGKEDNRRKHSKGPYPENDGEIVRPFPAHLFVWVSPSAALPFPRSPMESLLLIWSRCLQKSRTCG